MIPVHLGLQQRVLPIYRVPFFQALAAACPKGLDIFAGEPRPDEVVENRLEVPGAQVTPARNLHILRGGLYTCWQSGILRWLSISQPQVLILEANPRYLLSPAAVRWMHARNRPVIGWGLGAPAMTGPLAGLRTRIRQRFLNQFDAILTYSQLGREQYLATGFPAGRIFVARNAAAPRPTRPAVARPARENAAETVVLYVGRLQPRKRIDVLLRACAALPENLRPKVWIVGDGAVRTELQTLAADIYPQTRFLGSLYGAELDACFDQADLFVLPGTGGLAVQQAMAHALPVIVAEGDGTQSDLLRPENGWQVAPGSQADLTRALTSALSDPLMLRQMGLASHRIVSEEINLETMVSAFEQAILSVLPPVG